MSEMNLKQFSYEIFFQRRFDIILVFFNVFVPAGNVIINFRQWLILRDILHNGNWAASFTK